MRLKAAALGIRRVDAGPRGGHLLFGDAPRVDPARIIRLIQGQPRIYRLDGQHKLRFNRPSAGVEERLRQLHDLLDELARPVEAATGS